MNFPSQWHNLPELAELPLVRARDAWRQCRRKHAEAGLVAGGLLLATLWGLAEMASRLWPSSEETPDWALWLGFGMLLAVFNLVERLQVWYLRRRSPCFLQE
jgi:hypothetical protein